MTALPAWAATDDAKAIVAAIVAEQPSYYLTHGGWIEGGGQRRYQGPTCGKLRRIWNETRETLWEQAERDFAEGTPWADAVAPFNACAATPPDKLIEQLLHEPIEKARHVLTDRVVGEQAA